MKNLYMIRICAMAMFVLFGLNAQAQVTTIDFETANAGYTPSATSGTGTTDVFNRTQSLLGGNNSFYWAVEDLPIANPRLDLDQIDITGSTSFNLAVDLYTLNDDDWDDTDEMLITYSIDGGPYRNLLWVQAVPETPVNSFNSPAAIDRDTNGFGDCVQADILPAGVQQNANGCLVSNTTVFTTFTSRTVSISGNTTLDIRIQFNGLDATAESIYLDNITITEGGGAPAPSISTVAAFSTFNALAGLPGPSQTYTVSGSNLTDDVVIDAPGSFEVSRDGITFQDTVVLQESGGSLNGQPVTVYVRHEGTGGSGPAVGDLVHSTTGGANVLEPLVAFITPAIPLCTELIISEYIEGSSNNKAIEIYNPNATPVDLAAGVYSLARTNNGDGVFGPQLPLLEIIPAYGTYRVVNSGAALATLLSNADTLVPFSSGNATSFNGNDAVALFKAGVLIDVVGDPDNGANHIQDMTLVRKDSVDQPLNNYWSFEWDQFAQNTVLDFGMHSSTCTPPLPMAIADSVQMRGFLSIAGAASPALPIGVSGANLTNPIVVTCPAGYEVSRDGGATYQDTVVLQNTGTTLPAQPIVLQVRLKAGNGPGSIVGNMVLSTPGEVVPLNVSLSGVVTATPCSDLFISEYIEGSGNNKAIEIYNPTSASINLANYDLRIAFNGSTSFGSAISLGSVDIPAFGTFVIANPSANGSIQAIADATGSLFFNGNDVVGLFKNSGLLDIFGPLGNGSNFARDTTVVRAPSNNTPSTVFSAAGWVGFAQDFIGDLGQHLSECLPYWLGNTPDWSQPTNWSNNMVPTIADPVMIPTAPIGGLFPDVPFPIQMEQLHLQPGAQMFLQPTGVMTIAERLVHHGDPFFGPGTMLIQPPGSLLPDPVIFEGSSPLSIGVLAMNLPTPGDFVDVQLPQIMIWNELFLGQGALDVSASELRLRSNFADSAAFVDPLGSGQLIGDIVAERFIPGTWNGGRTDADGFSSAYHYLTPLFVNSSVSQFADYAPFQPIGSACLPNCNFNNIGTFFRYDETEAGSTGPNHFEKWKDVTSLNRGEGYAAHIRDLAGASTVMDFQGTYNHGAPFVANVTNSGVAGFPGFNLIGTGLPFPIDWDQIVLNGNLTNVDNAIHFWDGASLQYASYVNNISINGGSNLIMPMQGLFVHANAATGSVTFDAASAATNNGTFYKNGETREYFKLVMTAPSGFIDEAAVYYEQGATENYDKEYDGLKMFTRDEQAPTIYSLSNDLEMLGINGLIDNGEPVIIPLGVDARSNGSFKIEAVDVLNWPAGTEIILEDRANNIFHDLESAPYTFNMTKNEPIEGRFYLNVAKTSTGIFTVGGEDAFTVITMGNQILVDLEGIQANGTVQIFDMLGRLLTEQEITDQQTKIQVEIDQPTPVVIKAANNGQLVTKQAVLMN